MEGEVNRRDVRYFNHFGNRSVYYILISIQNVRSSTKRVGEKRKTKAEEGF